MGKFTKQDICCSNCATKVISGEFSNGIVLCNTCKYKFSPCPKCSMKAFIDNVCISCDFRRAMFECMTCTKQSSDGEMKNGIFKCKDCLNKILTSDEKYCPQCRKLTVITTDNVSGGGSIAGGDSWGTITKKCPCGYFHQYDY
jgi:hypothetical protein